MSVSSFAIDIATPKRKKLGGNGRGGAAVGLRLEIKLFEDVQRVGVGPASHARNFAKSSAFGQPRGRSARRQRKARCATFRPRSNGLSDHAKMSEEFRRAGGKSPTQAQTRSVEYATVGAQRRAAPKAQIF